MPEYSYRCSRCGAERDTHKPMSESGSVEYCLVCNAVMDKVICPVHISGTRDSFGINKAFIDPESKKEITTWKEWEKAGYSQLKDATPTKRRRKCMEKIKEKQDKLKGKITV